MTLRSRKKRQITPVNRREIRSDQDDQLGVVDLIKHKLKRWGRPIGTLCFGIVVASSSLSFAQAPSGVYQSPEQQSVAVRQAQAQQRYYAPPVHVHPPAPNQRTVVRPQDNFRQNKSPLAEFRRNQFTQGTTIQRKGPDLQTRLSGMLSRGRKAGSRAATPTLAEPRPAVDQQVAGRVARIPTAENQYPAASVRSAHLGSNRSGSQQPLPAREIARQVQHEEVVEFQADSGFAAANNGFTPEDPGFAPAERQAAAPPQAFPVRRRTERPAEVDHGLSTQRSENTPKLKNLLPQSSSMDVTSSADASFENDSWDQQPLREVPMYAGRGETIEVIDSVELPEFSEQSQAEPAERLETGSGWQMDESTESPVQFVEDLDSQPTVAPIKNWSERGNDRQRAVGQIEDRARQTEAPVARQASVDEFGRPISVLDRKNQRRRPFRRTSQPLRQDQGAEPANDPFAVEPPQQGGDLQDRREEFDRQMEQFDPGRTERDLIESLPGDDDMDNGFGDDDDLDSKPVEKSCQEFRDELLNSPLTDIALDISPSRSNIQDQYAIESRSWTDRYGNILGTGSLVDMRRGYLIIDGVNGQQKISYARLGDSDLAAVSEFWQVPLECTIGNDRFMGRNWTPQTTTWTASGLCHKPLYFENIQLERYGHSHGPILQPIHSSFHFFTSLLTLPYQAAIHPPNECQYALGFYRPGDCAPWLKDPVPISLSGIRRQALAVTGLSLLP